MLSRHAALAMGYRRRRPRERRQRDQRRRRDGLIPWLANHARPDRRRTARAANANRNNHRERNQPARDDLRATRTRRPSAPGRHVLRIPERNFIFPKRRNLSSREFPPVATHLRPLQPRNPLSKRNKTNPIQRRRLRRSKRRHNLPT